MAQEIRIPVVRRHFALSATGEAEISAMNYNQQWMFAETEEYFEALLSNGTWRRICQHALLRPGAVLDEALIVGANGCLGIDVEPSQDWIANAYALEFNGGTAAHVNTLFNYNGAFHMVQNIIYDATDARYEHVANGFANMVKMEVTDVALLAFATGAAGALADETAVTTNEFLVSSAIGTVVNTTNGDHNFAVLNDTAVAFFVDGAASGAGVPLVGINTITPVSLLEIWDDDAHPVLTITAQHDSDYNPQIHFRTDDPPTTKWALGVAGANDAFQISAGVTLGSGELVITAAGNVGMGTANFQAACDTCLAIAEGVAPGGATADQIYIWAQDDIGTAEAYVQDGAGNQVSFSPHNREGEWEFNCKNIKTGRVLNVQMEQLVKFLDKQFGTKFLTESEPL